MEDEKAAPTSLISEPPREADKVDADGVILKGWLTKQGSFPRNWKRRFFVLTRDHLTYFAEPEDKQPKGQINIRDCKSVKSAHSINWDERGGFVVTTPARTYYMVGEEKDRTRWIQCISRAIVQSKPDTMWDGEPDYAERP